MLRSRVITALILIVPVVGILLLGGWPQVLLALLGYGIITYEYYSFAVPYRLPERLQLWFLTLLLPLGYLIYGPPGLIAALLLSLLLIFCLTVVLVESANHQFDYESVLPASLLGLVYPGFLGTMLVVLARHVSGHYLLWVLLIVVAADTFAYFGGRAIGGAKLAPRISPNKTISGALCGLGGAILGSFLGSYLFGIELSLPLIAGSGVLAGVLAIFGDLTESLIKRVYHVKDSGTLLPGHGGLLDRIDALLFAAPILFLM